jgi:hypothetical protein
MLRNTCSLNMRSVWGVSGAAPTSTSTCGTISMNQPGSCSSATIRLGNGLGIGGDNSHVEPVVRAPRQGAADTAHTDNAHGPAHQFGMMRRSYRAHVLHGALLIELRHVVLGDAARQTQQHAHGGFRNAGPQKCAGSWSAPPDSDAWPDPCFPCRPRWIAPTAASSPPAAYPRAHPRKPPRRL